MDLRERLAQRREQQQTSAIQPDRQEASTAEVRHQGQHFDNVTVAQNRAYEEQFNGFKRATGQYPKEGELEKWVAEQQKSKQAPAEKVADPTFDKALSANREREQAGKQHIEMPKLMDALDRVSQSRQESARQQDLDTSVKPNALRR